MKRCHAKYMTFGTINKNKVSINSTIAVLNHIIPMFSLNCRDVLDSKLWISSDCRTVWNIAWAIYCWQEHQEKIYNIRFIQSIGGLFHLLKNALNTIMHADNGASGNPRSMGWVAGILCCKPVATDVKYFHRSNDFFEYLLDTHILACFMYVIKA